MRPLAPGLTLRRYRLQRRLGTGAFGDVWLAQTTKGNSVALKARPRKGGEDEREFRLEFERLRTLRIPSVVQVLDIGSDQGYVFFTMDVAQGLPFDQYTQNCQQLDERVRRTITAGAQIAHALASIHGLKLAHRDVKPANIMVNHLDQAVLLDFGTTRFGSAADQQSNQMGTPAYMAPEQRIGLPQDQSVDVYALGVMLHESISEVRATHWTPGRPRNSLSLLGPEVPLRLAWLVDQMVRLDPTERPTAERVAVELDALSMGQHRGPCPWPESPVYIGDASPLLEQSATVTGPRGTGRRRMIQEARWLWHKQGYRSVAGQCDPALPFSALRQIIQTIFMDQDPEARSKTAGKSAAVLQTMCPVLRVSGDEKTIPPTDFSKLAAGFAALLNRLAPIAIVFWDLDRADEGTREVLHATLPLLNDEVRVWAQSPAAISDLAEVAPPPWTPEAESQIHDALLPEPNLVSTPSSPTPLDSSLQAWRALAMWRGEPPPAVQVNDDLARLAILGDVFPLKLAYQIANQVDHHIETGQLRLVSSAVETNQDRPLAIMDEPLELEATDQFAATEPTLNEPTEPLRNIELSFADDATRLLARARLEKPAHHHLAVVRAWENYTHHRDHRIRAAEHALESGSLTQQQIDRVIRLQLERGQVAQLDRWLLLRTLHFGESSDFQTHYAAVYCNLELRPNRVTAETIKALSIIAESDVHHALIRYLQIIFQARTGAPEAASQGHQWAIRLHESMPAIAANMMREVAHAHLLTGDYRRAIYNCKAAMKLARESAEQIPLSRRPALTHAESNVSITLTGLLAESGELQESVRLGEDIASRARESGMNRTEGAILANLAVAQHGLGQRQAAQESLARCRQLQSLHRDPVVHTVTSILSARLAIEAGMHQGGSNLLYDAIAAAQGLQSNLAQAEAWSLALELAIHSSDGQSAQIAFSSYGVDGIESPTDNWPAVMARWFWLTGDLNRALVATDSTRKGPSHLCVRAERARILLLQKQDQDAIECAESLISESEQMGASDLLLFGRLVHGAAKATSDALFMPLLRESQGKQWIHLYLGGLHLDAIRRKRRGENVQAVLRSLQGRSNDLGHRLYMAIAQSDDW